METYESVMEVDDIQNQSCKVPRIRSGANTIGQKGDDEDNVEATEIGRFCGWPSSRMVRVSRASGGKDRHSKVWTSKGLRDRRVRLSVTAAIQFYDLQDRLGYDQPSKAVEWLLKAVESSISGLPSLNASFPDTPKQLSGEKRSNGFDFNDLDMDMDPNYHYQNQNASLSTSACSSTLVTTYNDSGGLSISRSENRMKARERARRRAAEKDKERETDSLFFGGHRHNVVPISQNSAFPQLLTRAANNNSPNASAPQLHNSTLDINAFPEENLHELPRNNLNSKFL